MRHEPECNPGYPVAKDQYVIRQQCICAALRSAYKRGYDAHARYRDMGEAPPAWVQHGPGENP